MTVKLYFSVLMTQQTVNFADHTTKQTHNHTAGVKL